MSHRLEALDLLYKEVAQTGSITVGNVEYKSAQKRVQNAYKELQEARKDFLRMDLARFYRIAIFGSARFDGGDEEFQFVRDLSCSLVKEVRIEEVGIDIVTGGGPGVMRAAHEGTLFAINEAKENGHTIKSKNLGINIDLPNTEDANGLAHISTTHEDFPPRLQEFLDKTRAAYNAPGGVGTLLELAMVLQLRQVGHLEKDYPIIAHPAWLPLIEAWNNEMYHKRFARERKLLISEDDLNLIQISDHIADIIQPIKTSHAKWYLDLRSKLVRQED